MPPKSSRRLASADPKKKKKPGRETPKKIQKPVKLDVRTRRPKIDPNTGRPVGPAKQKYYRFVLYNPRIRGAGGAPKRVSTVLAHNYHKAARKALTAGVTPKVLVRRVGSLLVKEYEVGFEQPKTLIRDAQGRPQLDRQGNKMYEVGPRTAKVTYRDPKDNSIKQKEITWTRVPVVKMTGYHVTPSPRAKLEDSKIGLALNHKQLVRKPLTAAQRAARAAKAAATRAGRGGSPAPQALDDMRPRAPKAPKASLGPRSLTDRPRFIDETPVRRSARRR
jgi:hypothetical protein